MRTIPEVVTNGIPLEEILRQDKPNLRGVNLACVDLSGANLSGANLRYANFAGANLAGANLACADLCGVNLRSADMCSVNLRGADMWDADLRGADLRCADLAGANLACADLRGTTGIAFVGCPGSRGDILYAVDHKVTVMFKTGCFWGMEEEFVSSVNKNHAGTKHEHDYLMAVELLKRLLR